jgi:hypothetical protein
MSSFEQLQLQTSCGILCPRHNWGSVRCSTDQRPVSPVSGHCPKLCAENGQARKLGVRTHGIVWRCPYAYRWRQCVCHINWHAGKPKLTRCRSTFLHHMLEKPSIDSFAQNCEYPAASRNAYDGATVKRAHDAMHELFLETHEMGCKGMGGDSSDQSPQRPATRGAHGSDDFASAVASNQAEESASTLSSSSSTASSVIGCW